MGEPAIRAFIQARMSSARFPGKVLAPLAGRPILAHVIEKLAKVIPADRITIATSAESSDDPLACYVRHLGIPLYRGPLEDVFVRFQRCLREYPCTGFFRICADSPLLESSLLKRMLAYTEANDFDLITNVFPRTFPRGQSVELIHSAKFASIDPGRLTPQEQEHVTQVFYNHPDEFRILNIPSANPDLAEMNLAVDTIEDLRRLEKMLQLNHGDPKNKIMETQAPV